MEPNITKDVTNQNDYESNFIADGITSPKNYSFSIKNTYSLTNILDLKLKEIIDKKISNNINDKLTLLEINNNIKEKEILDLMFSLHEATSAVESMTIKYIDQFTPTIQFKTSFNSKFNKSDKNGNLDSYNDSIMNRSTYSIMSRRSNSTSRNVAKKIFGVAENKDKTRLGAQKVTINIDLPETPVKNKREIQSLDTIKQAKLLEKNLKPKIENNANNVLTKNKSPSLLSSKSSTMKNLNKSSVKSNKTVEENNRNSNNLIDNSNIAKNKNRLCPFDTKNSNQSSNPFALNKKTSNKNSKDTNSTVETNKIPSSPTQNHVRPSYKFEPKKKNLSTSGSGFKEPIETYFSNPNATEINPIKASFKSENNSVPSSVPVNQEQYLLHSRNNSEQQAKCGSKLDRSSIFSKVFKNLSPENEKMNLFLNDPNNANCFNKIFEFLTNVQEKIKFKNISLVLRDAYLDNEIKNLEKIIDYKIKQENPLYNVKITDEDIFSQSLILSNTTSKTEGFENLIIILFIILLKPASIDDLIRNRNIDEMINQVETSVNNDMNIYSKYKEIIDNLKHNKDVYSQLKQIRNNSGGLFFKKIYNYVAKLPSEEKSKFNVLLELMRSVDSLLEIGLNLEIIIDIEILAHKLEAVKNYKNKI